MKIVATLVEDLYAVHYGGEHHDELTRLLEQWWDTSYLFNFYTENRSIIEGNRFLSCEDGEAFVHLVTDNTNALEDFLLDKTTNLSHFFRPLGIHDDGVSVLRKTKGKQHCLRLYALWVEAECYIITGGAIKITAAMQDHPETAAELRKLERCRSYLKSENVMDDDSFYEFLNEQSHE